MLQYDIAQLKASAPGRPKGYVEFVLKHGKIEGDFVFINETVQAELSQRFPPEKFAIAQLKADTERFPKGFTDFILFRGKKVGKFVELDLAALDELHEKFPVPTFIAPKEPTLAEMTANFTKAMTGWVAAGFKVVERGIFEKRHAICKSCEFWLPDARLGTGKCRRCGCSIYKLWMATSKCPLTPPKW
ncbi:MAG TPA: hypothetical protein VHC95_03160 [Opitutales bacterium]|nr:hypothetical protein [Opitutales bacterium]